MKRALRLLVTWACLALACAPTAMSAQNYEIDWYKVAGGGGTSSGGLYSLSGTAGQSDAGLTMSGGNYSVTGGFWALFAVQTPGAPSLRITLTATNTAVVSWPFPSTGYALEQTANLNGASWSTPAEAVSHNASVNYIIVNSPAGNRFYRLKK